MKENKRNHALTDKKAAPTFNEEDSYGEDATKTDVQKGDSTKVTRFVYDEYDPSDANKRV